MKIESKDVSFNKSYTIFSTGEILGPNKVLKHTKINGKNLGVTIGKKIYSVAQLVISHFSKEIPPFKTLNKAYFIDGNCNNVDISNLRYWTKEDYSKLAKKRY